MIFSSQESVWELIDQTNSNPLMVGYYTPLLHVVMFLLRQKHIVVKIYIIDRLDWPGMMRERLI